jgi:hypothetical protein
MIWREANGSWNKLTLGKGISLCRGQLVFQQLLARRTFSSRAVNVNQHCTMKIIVFLSLDNQWHLHDQSNLEHSFHAKLDNTAKVLGKKDLQPTDIRLVRSTAHAFLCLNHDIAFPLLQIGHIHLYYYKLTGQHPVLCQRSSRYSIKDYGNDS